MSAPLAVDFQTPVREGFTSFATFIPKLFGFLLTLIIGYVIARIIATLCSAVAVALRPGALETLMPFAVAAATLMLTGPL